MHRPFRWLSMAAVLAVPWPLLAQAQNPPALRDAADAAWSLSAAARSAAGRQAELGAREQAAANWLAGPPVLGLAHRTDRLGSGAGARENEFEIAAPIWSPGVRRATAGQVAADRSAFDAEQALARLKLAGEVRTLAAQHALARLERDAAWNKLREADALAADVARRVHAGEVARVETLQTQSVRSQAAQVLVDAEAGVQRAAFAWRALTGLDAVAHLDTAVAPPTGEPPGVAAARTRLQAARARLALAEADRRDPPELGLSWVRERAASGTQSERSLRLAVRVPLGTASRNAPRTAAARADADSAEADLARAEREAHAERSAAEAELAAAREAEVHAAARAEAAREAQQLVAKAWRLGEADGPARLRADAERHDAERAEGRARLAVRRAISQLNQSHGVLP